jgi:nucleoside-diphosphate-sugar epimerase
MKLLIFGATGPSGRILVQRALAAGHEVSVYARNPSKLGDLQGKVTIEPGELTDAAAIERAVLGKEAVISLLGPAGRSAGTPISDGMKLIVASMERHNVRRLIATATPSASDAQDQFRLSFWLAVKAVKGLAGTAYQDIVSTAATIRESKLDWTIARLPMLSNKQTTHPAAGYVGDPKIRLFSLSRYALADFLLAQLTETTWLRKAPALSDATS